jgi:hypothetical protein
MTGHSLDVWCPARCPTVHLPGYQRPLVKVADYLELAERSTYGDNRVRQGEPVGGLRAPQSPS